MGREYCIFSSWLSIAEDGEHDLTATNTDTACNNNNNDLASIYTQLSDFRSFGASLMVDSKTECYPNEIIWSVRNTLY